MGKTKKRRDTRPRIYGELDDPKHSHLIKQVLSPLQLAALERGYKAFTCDLGGIEIKLDRLSSWELMHQARKSIRFVRHRLFDLQLDTLRKDKQAGKFLRTSIRRVGMSKRMSNIFWARDCRTMADIARFGLDDFMIRGIGVSSRKWLFDLFASNGCSSLYQLSSPKKKR
jgi:hypothetical protein